MGIAPNRLPKLILSTNGDVILNANHPYFLFFVCVCVLFFSIVAEIKDKQQKKKTHHILY